MFFVYDSYLTPAKDWAQVLGPGGTNTLRGTRYDAAVIGLWVKEPDGEFMTGGHFDGFYTYFGADGFTCGSTSANWPKLSAFARRTGKVFVPSVGPGYVDTRIRPWNGRTTREREQGAYYDRLFRAATEPSPRVTHFVWVLSALILDGEQDNPVFRFHGGGYSVTLSNARIFC